MHRAEISITAACLLLISVLFAPAESSAGWSAMSSGTSDYINGIWGSSGSNIYATMDGGGVLHYNGTAWSISTSVIAGANTLRGIWGSSVTDIYIAGGGLGSAGSISHYDGTGWTATSSGVNSWMIGVWGSGPNDVFAVGYNGEIIHNSGSGWSAMTSGSTVDLYSVWGSTANDVYAVGSSGTILHYNGTSWSAVSSPTTGHLTSVWGSSATDIFAVGDGIIHYNGTSWSTMSNPASSMLRAVWGSGPNDVFSVGDQGTIVHYDGTSWSALSSGTLYALSAVWGTSSSNVFAGGKSGTLLHYNGTPATTTTTTAAAATTTTTAAANTAPSAGFTVTPPVGDTSTLFHLEPFSSSDAQDPLADLVVRIDWETDGAWDDTIKANQDTDHAYGGDGDYTITIEVEDTGGLTDQATQQVKVITSSSGNSSPSAAFSISPSSGDTATTFSFDATGCSDAEDSTAALEVMWDFDGDGIWDTGFSTGKTETRQYSTAGTYMVTLEVVDTGGMTDTAQQQLIVSSSASTTSTTIPGSNNAPEAAADVFPAAGTVDTEFEFTAEMSSDAEDPVQDLEKRWDFDGDGTWDTDYSTDTAVMHQYELPGTYFVTLEVKDTGGLTDEDDIEVPVEEGKCPAVLLYGEQSRQTTVLKKFRAELLQSRAGSVLVSAYYRADDTIYDILKKHASLRKYAASVGNALVRLIALRY